MIVWKFVLVCYEYSYLYILNKLYTRIYEYYADLEADQIKLNQIIISKL